MTFVVKNTGKLSHDFKIAAKKTPVLKPGKTARLLVTFKSAGAFKYVSTVKGDVARGLSGTFKLTAPPKPATPGNAALGKSVFVANCGTCHVLKAAGTRGTIGPNLDTKPLTYAALAKVITDGKSGTAMAAFKSTLTQAQIENVSAFVYASTH